MFLKIGHVRCAAPTARRGVVIHVRRHHFRATDVTEQRNAHAWGDVARGSRVTRVTHAMTSRDNLPGPVKYPRVDRGVTQHTPLLLSDVVVLRRVRSGQSIRQAVRDLNLSYSTITNRMHYLRLRFNVHSTLELAHHPIITPQLEENSD